MKRTILALALSLSLGSTLAGPQAFSGAEEFDRTLPTYPELGQVDTPIILASDAYRIDAGDSTRDAVVQDYGSV